MVTADAVVPIDRQAATSATALPFNHRDRCTSISSFAIRNGTEKRLRSSPRRRRGRVTSAADVDHVSQRHPALRGQETAPAETAPAVSLLGQLLAQLLVQFLG